MDAEVDILAYRDGFAEHRHVASTLLYERSSGRKVSITIAIPTYRRLALLKEALASAAAQRTDVPFEILVVDNQCESDGRETIDYLRTLATPDLRYFRNEQNVGMFGNWNRCLDLAKGDWITILNDDDLLHPTFAAECFDDIAADPSINLIGTRTSLREERVTGSMPRNIRKLVIKLNISSWRPQSIKKLRTVDYFLGNPHRGSLGILMRTELARALGGYTPSFFPSADFIFVVRYQQRYGAHFRSKELATYRIAVNESLKPSVVEGWVTQGLRLRDALMPSIALPRRLLSLYSRIMAAEVILLCRDYFAIDFSADSLRRAHGLPMGSVYVPFRLLRMLIGALSIAARR